MNYPKVIAEIGCNHCGNFDTALKMIDTLANLRHLNPKAKIDIAKFQKRTPKELLTPEEYNAPHPNPANSYGNTYGEHREALEFTIDQHKDLLAYCKCHDIDYMCSVWDVTAAKEIISLRPHHIKIPSAANMNFPLIKYICENHKGDIHLSLGMASEAEIEKIVVTLDRLERLKDTVLYACTSGYPIDFEDAYLLDIQRLNEAFGKYCRGIGYSGHHLGIAIDNAAIALGATYIERHFTLDRTLRGTDHAASLEPLGMMKLARDIRCTAEALQVKKTMPIIELEQRQKLKRIIHE